MATKTEVERLSVVETKVDRAVEDIGSLSKTVTDGFAHLDTKIDLLSAENDKKYAAKWVQTAVSFVVGIIVAAVLTALLALVIIPARQSANNPTTTTTTNTPTGSTSTTEDTPSAEAKAEATAGSDKQTDSDSSGGLLDEAPKLIP